MDIADLPPCEANMGSSVMEDGIFTGPGNGVPSPNLPAGPPPQVDFDWNLDGSPDRLTIDSASGIVRVDWGVGSIEVTGVHTNFEERIEAADGLVYKLPPDIAANVVPAGVADVTGDGLLDLVVLSMGEVGVLAGAGRASEGVITTFESLGLDQTGWHDDPVDLIDARDSVGEHVIVPTPVSSVKFVGDVSGDGIGDFSAVTVYVQSAGPRVFYAGKPCSNA